MAASGRQYDNERRIFDKIKDEISYIAENGSLCIHNGKVIYRGIIPDPLARRILEELKKQPGFEIVVSKEDACYIEDNHPPVSYTHLVLPASDRTARFGYCCRAGLCHKGM